MKYEINIYCACCHARTAIKFDISGALLPVPSIIVEREERERERELAPGILYNVFQGKERQGYEFNHGTQVPVAVAVTQIITILLVLVELMKL